MSRRALAAIIVSLLLLTLILVGGVLLFVARFTGGLGPAQVEVQAPQYPVPAHNTAAELLAAAAAVSPDRDAIAAAYQSPTAMTDPATTELLSRHGPHIRQAMAAFSGECLLPRRPFTDRDTDYWSRLRTLGRLLVLRGRLLEHAGRYGEAAQTHLQVLRLAEVTARNGAAMGSILGASMVAVATEDLERTIAAAAASGEGKALPATLETLYDERVTDEQTLLEEWAQMIEGSETMAADVARQQGTRSPAPGPGEGLVSALGEQGPPGAASGGPQAVLGAVLQTPERRRALRPRLPADGRALRGQGGRARRGAPGLPDPGGPRAFPPRPRRPAAVPGRPRPRLPGCPPAGPLHGQVSRLQGGGQGLPPV